MLTNELLRVRRSGGAIEPRWLDARARRRLEPIAALLIETLRGVVGETRDVVDDALAAIEHRPGDRLAVAGLRKLLLDRCELATPAGLDPIEARSLTFRLAAELRRELGPRDGFDRAAVLARAALELAVTPAELEARLFADLRARERLVSFDAPAPAELLDRYDLALAQGVLLRATRVTVVLAREEPARMRHLFRAARFHGLLHQVHRHDDGWRIELDGPFSLFSAVQRYGLRLAMFLPAVLSCRAWRLRAELRWGKSREPAWFELGPERGLVAREAPPAALAPELAELCARFRRLESSWTVAENDEIFALPGEAVCVPDLVFESRETGERVYLEAFGFWSRQAVWRRVETIRKGFPARILLAVSKQLRVSAEVLGEDDAGELYVYGQTPSARAILERLSKA